MKVKLIENWRKAWRMLSVQLAAVMAGLATAHEYWPQYVQWLPEEWVKWGALAIIIARVVYQPKLSEGGK